jgi:GNAT superfamily N-acetyltransferase
MRNPAEIGVGDLPLQQWTRGEFVISNDRARLDMAVIHRFLTSSYWAKGRSAERVALSVARSLPFGLYHGQRQIGFARVLTDLVTHALLADVFVLEEYRGKGLGTWLVSVVVGHPDLAAIRRFHLGTNDAHGLYRKFGFQDAAAGRFLDRINPNSDEPAA